jgi:hypothetical protein
MVMNKTSLKDRSLTQINWIRALDNKFSAQKAQKNYYKAISLEENSKTHRKSI